MAITDIVDVSYESWGGYEDPRLPTRIWNADASILGDASGGNVSAFMRFNLAGNARLDQHFSLEEFWYDDPATGVAITVKLETRNFGSVQTGIRNIDISFNTALNSAGVGLGMNLDRGPVLKPIFLGQQVSEGTPLEIVTIYPVVDGDTVNIWAGGYVWGPRSVSAPDGGIIRPVQGLFSR